MLRANAVNIICLELVKFSLPLDSEVFKENSLVAEYDPAIAINVSETQRVLIHKMFKLEMHASEAVSQAEFDHIPA